jgi:mannose-6-phosphate isomerase
MDKFEEFAIRLRDEGFTIVDQDFSRPWGGYFVIGEHQAQDFADKYFDGLKVDSLRISGQLSPKILIVAPGKRLSWQYHNRRAEIWQIIEGDVAIEIGDTDTEGNVSVYTPGESLMLEQGQRHRLIGLTDWGVVAEIWQHTDGANPSDENDIIRVQDDYGRR